MYNFSKEKIRIIAMRIKHDPDLENSDGSSKELNQY